MTKILGSAVSLVLLAGCAMALGAPRPVDVRLDAERLHVRMDDGSRCSIPRAGGAGRFDRCGGGMGWEVREEARPNILRRGLEQGLTALGGQQILQPMATVIITAADGNVSRFELPDTSDLGWND